jgi:hypothetical protein
MDLTLHHIYSIYFGSRNRKMLVYKVSDIWCRSTVHGTSVCLKDPGNLTSEFLLQYGVFDAAI